MSSRLLVFFLLFSPITVFANTGKIIFDADFMEKNSRTKVVTLKGNVNVIFKEQHLLCDEAKIFETTKTIVASGNVILQTPKTTLRGKRIEFNYDTNLGKLENGIITSGQVLIESDFIEKVGEEEYVAQDAYYTACLTCPPSWGFTSKKIRADIGGYAYIYRPWLYLLQFPVLPLPYLAVPLNTKRQTGFLVPEPEVTSKGGWGFRQPFFWAIDRSQDLTLSGILYEKRGVQGLLNYRYVLDTNSSGEMNTGYLRNDRATEAAPDRWFFDYTHSYSLPNRYVQRTQLQLAGDVLYARDFQEQFNYYGQPALDNRVSLTKNYDDAHLSIDASYYIGLLDPQVAADGEIDPIIRIDSDQNLHRMPQINFRTSEKQIFSTVPVNFSFEAQYLNISRLGIGYDHVADANTGRCGDTPCIDNSQGTGNFQYLDSTSDTGDLIRTGQRIDTMATFSSPFWLGRFFDIEPSMNLRWTQYSLGVESDPDQGYDSHPNRAYAQFNLSARTFLSRTFNTNSETKFKHTLVPQINYQVIPVIEETESRFFGTREDIPAFREKQPVDDNDLDIANNGRGIQFDYRDRIVGQHLLTFSLTNKIMRKRVEENGPTYFRSLWLQLSQSYDIKEAEQPVSRPWQDIQGLFLLQSDRLYISSQANYYPYHGRTNLSSFARYFYTHQNFLSLGYSVQYIIPEDPADKDDNTRSDSILFGNGFQSEWLDFIGNLEYAPKTAEWKRWSVFTTIKPPGRCWLVKANITQLLDVEAVQFSVSMEFRFGQ